MGEPGVDITDIDIKLLLVGTLFLTEPFTNIIFRDGGAMSRHYRCRYKVVAKGC